jgi:type III restriction enzyme
MERLRQWCEDINAVQQDTRYSFVYVDQENFDKYPLKSFRELIEVFAEYQEPLSF